jgi:hypothetical protein
MDAKVADRGRFYQFDPVRCDGPAMLAALTILKREGADALAKLDKIVAGIATKSTAAEEWAAIRRAMEAAAP